MLLKSFTLAVGLLLAAPVLAGEPSAAALSSQPPGAQGGTCSACSAPGGGGTCAAPEPGMAPQMTDEEWKEFVRKKFLESQAEQPEPVDPDPFAFSAYRGQRPEPMGSQTIINGARMEIATLIVQDPPYVVEKAYYETFERMGFRPLAGDVPYSPGVRYLSFRPTGSKKLKTVTLVPNGAGTVILASVGNPEELLVKKPELPGDVPLPPGARASSAIQQVEPGASSRSAFFLVPGATPDSVREFYRRELPQRGFAPVPHSAQQDSESFEKNGALLSISAKPHTDDPDTAAVSLVWLQ